MKDLKYCWLLALRLELMLMLYFLDIIPKLSQFKPFENRVYSLADGINILHEQGLRLFF